VTMARPKANALNETMVEELNAAVDAAASDESVRGVVLASSRENFFSGGFDVKEVFEYDRERMTEFFGRFIDLYEGMLGLPKPVVAAVSGHAFAGGAVLALASDARVMAEGKFGFALNEINLGIALPPGIIRMTVSAVGIARARELLLEGKTVAPAEALEAGLASELASAESVLERACMRARELCAKPPLTYGAVKRGFNKVTATLAAESDRQALDQFIDHWFSEESKRHRRALLESLQR
jgi:enoyl-CoA hydratase/carnithine racemase